MSPALIDSWEWTLYDQRMQWTEPASPHPDIVLIGRDAESERQLGTGIWDRAVFATMIQSLKEAGARVVALDFAFIGPSPQARGGHTSDVMLAKSIQDMGNVVLPLPVQIGEVSPARQIGHDRPSLDHFPDTVGSSFSATDTQQLEHASLLGAVLPELFNRTHQWGHIAAQSDDDGVFRHVPAFLRVQERAIPAFSVAIAAAYLNVKPEDIVITPGTHVTLRRLNNPSETLTDLEIPVNPENQLLLNYAGKWPQAPFPYLLFSDVLEKINEGASDELNHWVEDKIVLIFHAGAEHDRRRTPLELKAPGGFIHANAIQTILTRSFLSPISMGTQFWILLILTMMATASVVYGSWRWGWCAMLIIIGGYLLLSQLSFSTNGRIYPFILPLLGMLSGTGVASAWAIWNERHTIENLEITLEHSQEELVQTRKDLTKTESTVQELEQELKTSRTKALASETAQQQIIQAVQELEHKLLAAETELQAWQSDVKRLERDLEESRTKYLEEDQPEIRKVQDLEDQLHQADMRRLAAESTVMRLEEVLEGSRKEMVIAEMNRQQASQQAKELEAKLHAVEAKWNTAKHDMPLDKSESQTLQPAGMTFMTLSNRELTEFRQECETQHQIFTTDTRLLSQYKDLKKIAPRPMSILILGEPGTGKELFAQAVHTLSALPGNYVTTNMAAIPGDLFESAFFGHRKGSFSGATQDHVGYFEQADGGTIFLDEIGDLRIDMQAKILRAIQEGSFYPVGAKQQTTVKTRIVAATNKDLLKGIEEGWFRRDLYDRLASFRLWLPPLRERNHDLKSLAARLVQRAGHEMKRENIQLSKEALEAMTQYPWPGNIRELQDALRRAVVFADQDVILAEDLRLGVEQPHPNHKTIEPNSESTQDVSGDQALLQCLRQHRFDMQRTAKAVGWERSTVTQRLKGLCFQALVDQQFDRSKAAGALAQQDPAMTRLAEQKLNTYYDSLLRHIAEAQTLDEALALCRQRLKNLPDRHLPAMEALVRHHFKK